MQEPLSGVDPSGSYWTIRAVCAGGRFEVDFDAERLSASGLGYASKDEIAVECGNPERVGVSDEELRSRTPNGAELVQPTYEPSKLSCRAEGSLVVEAHPVWGHEAVVGAALRVARGDLAILEGAVLREGYTNPPSQVQWLSTFCRLV